MLRTYRTGSWPTRAAATRSTLLNHKFGSSFSACASRRNDWILPGPALYAAKANRLRFWSSNWTQLEPIIAPAVCNAESLSAREYLARAARLGDLAQAAQPRLDAVDVIASPTLCLTPPLMSDVVDADSH